MPIKRVYYEQILGLYKYDLKNWYYFWNIKQEIEKSNHRETIAKNFFLHVLLNKIYSRRTHSFFFP